MFDLIIKNGKIADGTGKDCYISDIGVKDGVINKIGALKDEAAERVIDAKGKIVTPGFIDMHSHGDITLLMYPKMESKVMQGITTIVGGNCGLSIAPLNEYWVKSFFETDVINEIFPFMYAEGDIFPIEKVRERIKEKYGMDLNWKSFDDFLNRVEDNGISANFIPFVGHGQIKAQAMGEEFKRCPTDEEIKKMQKYVAEAMESGAYGMSVGLDYVPGAYSDFDELLKVSSVLKKYNGIYAAHCRRTGLRAGTPKKYKKIDGIIETLEVGRQLDIQVQISHLFPGFDVYPSKNEYMMKAAVQATLQVIDSYVEKGVRASFDVIPSLITGFSVTPSLAAVFWPWVKQAGSSQQFIKNLRAKDYKMQMIDLINSGEYYLLNPISWPEWDEYTIIVDSINKNYINKSMKEIADLHGINSVRMMFDLLIEDPEVKVSLYRLAMTMENVKEFLSHPMATVGTDTFAFDIRGPWSNENVEQFGWLPSENTYCAMIKYMKELGMERIEDTIRKITGKPAEILGLINRGIIKEGCCADILLIDIDNLRTNENHVEPRAFPEGIEYVLINGKVVVDRGKHTGELAGKVLRKNRI